MKKSIIFFIAVCICLTYIFASGSGENIVSIKDPGFSSKSTTISPGNHMKGVKPDIDFGKIPLYFITNKGQVNERAKFYTRASRYTLWMTKRGLVFDSVKRSTLEAERPGEKRGETKRDISRMVFVDADRNPALVALDRAKLKVNYFKGNDKSKWNCNIPTSMAVLYEKLYKNIDLKVYGIEKQIEYDWLVKTGGDPGDIKFKYENVKGTRIDKEGNLLIETGFGELMHKCPFSYQVIGGEQRVIDVEFKKIAEDTYGFAVGDYDPTIDLVIDPVVLAYSTYLGGGSSDYAEGIAIDADGNVYVAGTTDSTDFPTLNEYQTDPGDTARDVFVSKLDPTESGAAGLLYSTYIGGGDDDRGNAIAVDSGGNVYVAGTTNSINFPTVNEYQTDEGDSNSDAFVLKLDTSQSGASGLLYSTYLGGLQDEYGTGIAVDTGGNAYVTGNTNSLSFPFLNEYQGKAEDGSTDAFMAKLDPAQSGVNSLLYATCLGGDEDDSGRAIAVDSSGNAYVTGDTNSTDFPTRDEYQSDPGDTASDVFVTKLDPALDGDSSLLYSTYLGGGGEDYAEGIAVDAGGNAYVTGRTYSTNFPTLNEYQADEGDSASDAFVTKLDPSQSGTSGLLYSTYLGGGASDSGLSITVDSGGNTYVTGYTGSTNFPTLNEYQTDPGDAQYDVIVVMMDLTQSGTSSLIFSTYLGGTGNEEGNDIAVDGNGNVYVTGESASTDFPVLNQYQSDQTAYDAFITKLSFVPTVDTPTSAAVTYTTATLGGNVSNIGAGNVTERGIYWSTTDGFTPPSQGTKVSETGSWGTGVFTVNATGLPGGTTIYFQAFAANSAGSGYSSQSSFTTATLTIPVVTTTAISGVTSTTAAGGGNVTSNGGASVTARGVCWSTNANPTTTDSTTSDGTGTGAFTSGITGLSPGTTYYVRAYAVNSVGTSYGSELSFTAGTTAPTVTTTAASGITSTTASSGGNVTSDGGATVTARGVCWSTTANPTTTDSTTSDGTGTGTFTSALTGLLPNTSYYVRAYAVNSAGTSYGSDLTFATNSAGAAVITSVASSITSTTATSGGNVTSDGGAAVTARGVCWSTSANPTTADSTTSDGSGTGAFSSAITGLSADTTYHVRAYAVNSSGTVYGSDLTFTTGTAGLTVTTTAVSSITSTTASSGGNVTSNGGSEVTARGVCWSTSANPTTTDSTTSDGTGTGEFTSGITGLLANTTYYVRAYAVNSDGTSYGSDLTFSTGMAAPTVTTTAASSITSTTASSGGNVTSNGGSAVTARGVCWSTSANPTTADGTTSDGTGTGVFSSGITGLSAYTTYHVRAYAVNSVGTSYGSDLTFSTSTPPEILLNRTHLNYGSVPETDNSTLLTTSTQTILINNTGGGVLNWTATDDADWLILSPGSGTGKGAITVTIDPSGIQPGTYTVSITIEAPNAVNSPQTVPVTLTVYESGTTTIPFGYFETPIDGSTVTSSIPVTGWALDDIDITSVKIYRAPIPGHETGGLVYIGDAIMVDGARPDVEQQFPTYPKDYQAGWGYMMLTNMLPNDGNGTFTIYAKATDTEGNEIMLGSKTIICDNANAVKPFGAIDTPEQGGTASGSSYINFGWALTPQPNTIPIDGSSIEVWVDGVPLGNPVYNQYREDIATRFPGYNNSDGAVGYFYMDTASYLNGVHTIAWSVKDDAGNTDGIGSRYFTVVNSGTNGSNARRGNANGLRVPETTPFPPSQVRILEPSIEPVILTKGFAEKSAVLYSNPDGAFHIEARETERIEIQFGNSGSSGSVVSGYLLQGDQYRFLPVGSTIDSLRNIFYWQPGPGFYGNYTLVFVEEDSRGRMTRKLVQVNITAKK